MCSTWLTSPSMADPANDFADLSGRRACRQFDDDVLYAEDDPVGGGNEILRCWTLELCKHRLRQFPCLHQGIPQFSLPLVEGGQRHAVFRAPRFDGPAAALRAGDGVAPLLRADCQRSLFHGRHPSRCVYFLERSKEYTFVFYASILPCGFSFRKYVVSLGAYTVSVKGILSLKSIDFFLNPL